MRVIRLTQELKDKNSNLFEKYTVGQIVYTNVPQEFNGIENVVLGYDIRLDLQQTDGWRDLVIPSITATQRLGNEIIEVAGVFTYAVIDYTVAEIATQLASSQDLEDQGQEEKNEEEGLRLIRRWRKRARRRVKNNVLTQAKFKTIRKLFNPLFVYLEFGDWDLAKDDINLGVFLNQTDNDINREINWLRDRITEYIME